MSRKKKLLWAGKYYNQPVLVATSKKMTINLSAQDGE